MNTCRQCANPDEKGLHSCANELMYPAQASSTLQLKLIGELREATARIKVLETALQHIADSYDTTRGNYSVSVIDIALEKLS